MRILLLCLSWHQLLTSVTVHARPVLDGHGKLVIPLDSILAGAAKAMSDYAPRDAQCPTTPLTRTSAGGLSSGEALYLADRKPKAATALAKWIKQRPGFADLTVEQWPSLALTSSGGGHRALLAGAGVVKGLDEREGSVSRLSGLYQALTYHAGLSGGGWLLSSLAASDWQTVTALTDKLWRKALDDGLLQPGGIIAPLIQVQAFADVEEKDDKGYDPTLTDTWSRLLSVQLYEGGIHDGNQNTLTSIMLKRGFQMHAVPYPILTAVLSRDDECLTPPDSPMIEMHPYEWGSWDDGVGSFASTAFLGTKLDSGKPAPGVACVNGFDNLGFIAGTSSNIFTAACAATVFEGVSNLTRVVAEASLGTFNVNLGDTTALNRDFFAVYPNPFRGQPNAPLVKDKTELRVTDGGLSNQNNPIWPLIQPARAGVVDVLIVNDNSADVEAFPDGRAIIETFTQARARGLTRMPKIPGPATFVERGYHKQATFFGCFQPETLTIIYVPNARFSFPSNQSTLKLQYSSAETDGMIQNGVNVIDQGGMGDFDVCVACAIMMKSTAAPSLPPGCRSCLARLCYSE